MQTRIKANLLSSCYVISLILIAGSSGAIDFPGPDAAISTVENFNSYSWDNTAGGWAELKNVKAVSMTFDKEKRALTRRITYDNGTLMEKTVYRYSANFIKKETFNHENKLIRYSESVTVDGKTTETVYFPNNSVFEKTILSFGAGGLPQKSEQYDSGGGLTWIVTYSYDDKKNCTGASYFNADGSAAFESYFEYGKPDKNGNWTVRTEYCTYADVGNRPKEISYRTIVYAE